MKLKELLKVIPDRYLIGLADADIDSQIVVFGNKTDAILGYGQKKLLTTDVVNNLNVIAIHPGVNTYLTNCDMYCDDDAPLHVKTKLLIDVSPEEKEDD